MKARIKETGEIVEVEKTILRGVECYIKTTGEKIGSIYMEYDLDFGFDCDYAPDYWTKLEHQYAGMAMQGILTDGWGSTYISNPKSKEQHLAIVTNAATEIAHALVEKMKEERK